VLVASAASSTAPASVADWRALLPSPAAQETIDAIVEGLSEARESEGSYLHRRFEHDTKIPLRKQPQEPVQWLAVAKSLLLTNADPFEELVLDEVGPISVFTGLEHLQISVTPSTDPPLRGDRRRTTA